MATEYEMVVVVVTVVVVVVVVVVAYTLKRNYSFYSLQDHTTSQ